MSTTASRSLCTITVRVQSEFDYVSSPTLWDNDATPADFEDTVATWRTAIHALWNKTWNNGPGVVRWNCATVKFEFDMPVGSETTDYHQVSVYADGELPGGTEYSNTDIGLQNLTARWEVGEDEVVAAHEAGHMMALKDEYERMENGNTVSLHTPEIASNQPQCLMAYTGSTFVTTLKEHLDTMMAALEMKSPFYCCMIRCPWELLRRLRWWRKPPPEFARDPFPPIVLPPDPPRMFRLAEEGPPRVRAFIANRVSDQETLDSDVLVRKLSSPSVVQRWLAAIGLSRVRDDDAHAALIAALSDRSISVRVQAARSLLWQGNEAGLPALLDALSSDEEIIRHPRTLARDYAHRILRRFASESFDFQPHGPARERVAAIERWRAWHERR